MTGIHSALRCQCRKGSFAGLCRMPPAPTVVSALYMEFLRKAKKGTSFASYLESVGFIAPSLEINGMDDRGGSRLNFLQSRRSADD